jgi:hypothetical protein
MCDSRFQGKLCEINEPIKSETKCGLLVPCNNNGKCLMIDHFYSVCLCSLNFTGKLCEIVKSN